MMPHMGGGGAYVVPWGARSTNTISFSRHESVRLKLIEGAGQMSINYDLEAITRQEDLKAGAGEIVSQPVRNPASRPAMAAG